MPSSITSQSIPAARRLLDTTQLCELLGIGHKAVEKWRLHGKGPRFIKVGKLVRYDEADVFAWIEERKRGNTSQSSRPHLSAV